MGTKYTTNTVSGYNSTPPSDDGTVSEANKVKYSTIKTKLSDPINTAIATINSELVTHFDNGPVAYTSTQTLGAAHYNQIVQVSGSGVTLNLTDASSLAAGWYCDIVSTDSSNSVTLARATASNTINEVSSDVTILPLQQLRVIVNAAATGFLVSHSGRHSKIQKPWTKGADIASASALTLGADGNYFDVTGTTAITSIGTVGIGTIVKLHFDAALTLTHHATDLYLPGGANITTAAGDEAEFIEYASADWRCTSYTRANGTPIVSATDIQVYTSNDTWTKPASAKYVEVFAIGPGGGGGGGRRNAGGNAYGGGSGGAGGVRRAKFEASDLSATVAVTIGAAGTGGAGKSTNVDGDPGTAGGTTSFGAYLVVPGGGAGLGGTNTAAGTDGTNQTSYDTLYVTGGGGTGGFATSGSSNGSEAGTGSLGPSKASADGGGAAGADDGGAGGTGGTGSATDYVGAGGGGGGSGNSASEAGGAGGDGGDYGGGGGGGGAAGFAASPGDSGAGGAGGDSIMIVISY